MSASVSSRTLRPTIYVGQRGCVVRAGTTDGPAKFSGYNHQRQALMYAYSLSRFAGPAGSNDTSDIDVIHVDDAVLADLAAGKTCPEPVQGYTLKATDAYARVKGTVFEGRTEQPLDQPPNVTSPIIVQDMGETAIIPPIANIPQFSVPADIPQPYKDRINNALDRADSTTAKDPIEAVRAKIMDDMHAERQVTSLRLLAHRVIEPGTELSGTMLVDVMVEPGSTIMEAASRAAKLIEEKIAAGMAEALRQELEKRNAPRGKSYSGPSTAEPAGPVFPGLDVAAELEQARVQLAGCLTAAESGGRRDADKGSYGWSPAYEAVLRLAVRDERRRLLTVDLQYELQRTKEKHGKASELIAKMHGAAVGKFGDGPRRGVLEDVIDLRTAFDCQRGEIEQLRKVALRAEHDRDLAQRARNEINAINNGHCREIAQLRDQLIDRKSDLNMANDAAHQWQRVAEENEKRYNAIRQELLKKENSHASRVNATS